MVSDVAGGSPLHDVKLSSVVPKSVTGEGAVHELTGMDLAMKLHYVRVVYYFTREDVDGLDIFALKRPMFDLLDVYCSVSGRIRQAEGGRPVIKCNDAGVRIIEGQCNKSLDEWLDNNNGEEARHKQLVSGQIVGPVVHFSPLVLIQFTWFKCGGMAVGLSWAHVLGDAVTAAIFINMWGKLLAGKKRMISQFLPRTSVEKPEGKPTTLPLSMKMIDPVGDKWIASNKSDMKSFSFTVPPSKLKQIQSKISSHSANPFDAISALVWKYLAKFRETKIVTICRNDGEGKGEGLLSNKQIIITVETHLNVAEAELSELAQMISEAKKNENKEIEAMAEDDGGTGDYIVYGANLTFVDLQDADLYGLEIKGKKPVHVNFSIDGVGDEGAVIVYKESGKGDEGGSRAVIILPEDQALQLMTELQRGWTIN